VHAALLALIAGGLAAAGVRLGGPGLLLLWPALSFAIVAAAYLGPSPGVFGKTSEGAIGWRVYLYLGPFLLYTRGLWCLSRLLSREPAWNPVAEGLYLGRRVSAARLPEGIGTVVDLTAELPEPAGVRSAAAYRCLPVLDGTAPGDEDLARLVGEIAGAQGAVYVHCAQGHGRSALVVAAVLLARGLAGTPEEALRAVRAARPGIGLRRSQLDSLARFSRPQR
jgi:hypothetical protein